MRRQEAKERSREALIKAGLALIAEQGIDAPSLDAICERAGYTRGAFYVHFADREALLAAVMEEVGRSYLASVLSAAPVTDLRSAIHRFVDSVEDGTYPLMSTARKGKGGPMVRPHQLLAACARSREVRDHYKALVDAATHAVAGIASADTHVRKDLSPTVIAELALAVIIGAQTLAELDPKPDAERPKRLASAFETLLAKRR